MAAELAAYGGFSASNYLEVPYTSALDFGMGDFCIAVWVNIPDAVSSYRFFERNHLTVPDSGKRIYINSTAGVLNAAAGGSALTAAAAAGRYQFVVLARRSGILEFWTDGAFRGSQANTQNLSFTDAITRLGNGVQFSTASGTSIALPRLSATAPTPAQIRAMYEAERPLFEANAKCLLPGDSVSALAYDDTTELLHVATTAGSARLRGLAVVDKDATVYTGLDARGGIVATRDSGSADVVLPALGLREAMAASLGHNGGPPLYDRRTAQASGVTTNATPTVIARFPMDKDEAGEWVIRTWAREYGDPTSAELAAYEDVLFARRAGEGNVEISGSATQRVIREVTSSMAVTVAANTTTQCIEVTATGVAAKNLEWSCEGRLAA